MIYSAWNTYFYKYLCRGTLEVERINYKQENGILKCALTLFAPALSWRCSTLTELQPLERQRPWLLFTQHKASK